MLLRSYKIGTCWICQSTGPLTREHKFKASGLREQIDSTGPFTVVVDNQMDNFRIARGRKSDALKFGKTICGECNSSRTQPGDLAFDSLRKAVELLAISGQPVQNVWLDQSFLRGTFENKNVFRYFAKLFGCHLADSNWPIPINIAAFAGRKSDRNCIWLDIHRDGNYVERRGEEGHYVAHGGLVVVTKKPKFFPHYLASSVSFGPIQYAYRYYWTWPEKLELHFRFHSFVRECAARASEAVISPLTVDELTVVGLIHDKKY